MPHFETIIIGAGAAGLFCGAERAARGNTVLVLDHARKPAEKVRISGGGRCNFTNIHTDPKAFLSQNPHFAKSALSRFSPEDFCQIMAKHDLSWHEKTLGQLFCDQKSGAVIAMLLARLEQAGGKLRLETEIGEIRHIDGRFEISTNVDHYRSNNLIIATGGLSIPKMGATDFGYRIAEQFGHTIVPTRPALVPFTFTGQLHAQFAALSGVATATESCAISGPAFREGLLFTHRGLSGPAMLQISSYWNETEAIEINLLPEHDAAELIQVGRAHTPRLTVSAALNGVLPARLAQALAEMTGLPFDKRLGDLSKQDIANLVTGLHRWSCRPAGTEGWRTAEVTVGGVDTKGLSSQTMESRYQPGLYFIGECVDVTGWLGGYNFQWAWASAKAAGEV